VLYAVAEAPDGLAPREVSDRTGLSRQTVYHLVHTLTEVGLLRRGAGNRLVLGLGVGALAAAFQHQLVPEEQLRPYVNALAARTGELAYSSAWLDGEITVVAVARGSRVVQARDVVVGNRDDAAARASGKLLLALAPEEARNQYLSTHRLTRRTARTKTNRRELDREFEGIVEQGFAVDEEEFADGLSCIAVPLRATSFVIGISVPADRFRAERERYLESALEVAAEKLG